MTRHRYGSTVVKGDAELRDKYGLPIFIGEFGHWNGGTDMTAQIVSNMKSSGIGYTYWPFKKMDNWESLLGFETPEGWQQISAFVSPSATLRFRFRLPWEISMWRRQGKRWRITSRTACSATALKGRK